MNFVDTYNHRDFRRREKNNKSTYLRKIASHVLGFMVVVICRAADNDQTPDIERIFFGR